MARARNIKPGFFKNEQLVELPFEYRLLFCGLWVLADREGRLEDRPKRIRMEIFPADDVNVQAGLEALSKSGFITRYLVAGQSYIQIDNFLKHQNPHHKEAESIIPEPEADPGLTPSSMKQEPEARLGQASDLERVERGVNRADSLIPDSLIPDSNNLTPSAMSEKVSTREAASKTKANSLRQITANAVESFNQAPFTIANGGRCSNVSLVNDVRQKEVERCVPTASAICKRLYGSPAIVAEFWTDYWATVDGDPFHSGRIPGSGDHAGWAPSFEFLTRPKTMTKLFDKAMSGPPPASSNQPTSDRERPLRMEDITV